MTNTFLKRLYLFHLYSGLFIALHYFILALSGLPLLFKVDYQNAFGNQPEFFGWMIRLHGQFFLGAPGKIYAGVISILYVLTLLSGFIIYGRFMKGRRFGEIRAATSTQKYRDYHRFAGMITFGWSLIVGITGAILAFNDIWARWYFSNPTRNFVHELPLYQRLMMKFTVAHFGIGAGLGFKIIWMIFTLISLSVIVLGVSAYFAKQKRQKMIQVPLSIIPMKHHGGSRYATPAAITVISVIATVSCVFVSGTWLNLSSLLLVVPILTFVVILVGENK